MYRLTVETLLGLQLEAGHLRIAPCIPAHWDSYKIRYRYLATYYHITVVRIVESSEQRVTLDGIELNGADIAESANITGMHGLIPLVDDQQEHHVEVRFN